MIPGAAMGFTPPPIPADDRAILRDVALAYRLQPGAGDMDLRARQRGCLVRGCWGVTLASSDASR
jgi:hypothetical protein